MGKFSKKKTATNNEANVVVGDVTKKSEAPKEPSPQIYLGGTPKETFSKKQKLWIYGILAFLVVVSAAWLIVNQISNKDSSETENMSLSAEQREYVKSVKTTAIPKDADDATKLQYQVTLIGAYVLEKNCTKATVEFTKISQNQYVNIEGQQLDSIAECYKQINDKKTLLAIYKARVQQMDRALTDVNSSDAGLDAEEKQVQTSKFLQNKATFEQLVRSVQ